MSETDAPPVPTAAVAPTRAGRRRAPAGAVRFVFSLAAIAAIALVPLTFSDYWLYEATLVAIWGVAIMGLSILFGFAGQISLGQAAFVGLGAYTGGLVSGTTGIPLWGEFLIVFGFAIIAGVVVGLPALRVSGLRLALITLAFGGLLQWTIIHTPNFSGGTQGLFVDPATLGGFSTLVPWQGYLFAVAFAVIGSAIMFQIPRTPLGRAMFAVRDTELAASSVGVSLTFTKLLAFVLASVYAGVAGWLFGHQTGAISQSTFDLFQSVNLLVAVIIGGAGSVAGAWIGAAYLVLLPELFRTLGSGNLYPIASGFLLVIIVLLAPSGVVSLFGRGRDRLQARWRR